MTDTNVKLSGLGMLGLAALILTIGVVVVGGIGLCTDGFGTGELTVQLDGTNGTSNGLCFYEPRPYLLVARAEGASDLTAQIVWLPDPNRRYRVNLKPGIGTANLSVKLQNGWMLESIGAQTDTKLPETITAIGGVVKTMRETDRTKVSHSEFVEGLYFIDVGTNGVVTLKRHRLESAD